MNNNIDIYQELLEKQLWEVADDLRGHMNPDEYQKYVLGILFYKYLSEVTVRETNKILVHENLEYEEAWGNSEAQALISAELLHALGFVIQPEYLFDNLVHESRRKTQGTWNTDLLKTAFNKVIESTIGTPSQEKFAGLFDDVDVDSSKLGSSPSARNTKLGSIVQKIGAIDFKLEEAGFDVLGNAYEYLMSEFAASAGKKGGEFYTPQAVSKMIANILAFEKPNFTSSYDPTCGSGSLLLQVANKSKSRKELVSLYGQELNSTTFNYARMNMFVHNVPIHNWHLANGNTLEDDLHRGIQVDVIAANPPYSAKWAHTEALEQDPRYAPYGKLAPKDKADYAFVINMIHHLKDDGIAAVVLPHGVLFREGAEGVIRKKLIQDNVLHAVIGLPSNLFYGTSIATSILVFKKGREKDEDILFVDASDLYRKGKNQNHLEEEHLTSILDVYKTRSSQEGFSQTVSLEEIKSNDYNLNIARYVYKTEQKDITDLRKLSEQLAKIEKDKFELEEQIQNYMANTLMGITDTKELVTIFEKNGIKKINPKTLINRSLLFIVKQTEPDPRIVDEAEQLGITLNPNYISAFIGYKWGDHYQDDKVEKYFSEYDFYVLQNEDLHLSFHDAVISNLKKLEITASKTQHGVIGISPFLKFSTQEDAAWGQFDLDFTKTNSVLQSAEYFLSYPHAKYLKLQG